MASHMRGENDKTSPQPQLSESAQPSAPQGTSQTPPSTGASGEQSPYEGAQRFKIPDEKPHRKWPALILILVIALVGVLFVGRFVWPDFFNSIPVIGDVFGTKNEQVVEGGNPDGQAGEGQTPSATVPEHVGSVTDEQSGEVQASDGATFTLTSDMRSPVELTSVDDNGVTLRFASDLQSGYNTVHIVGCEINGQDEPPTSMTPSVFYTIHNESTNDTNESPDPYFIISPVNGQEDYTSITIRKEGFTAADYQSVKLKINQTFAYGELSSGDYEVAEVNDLFVDVTRS